MFVQKLFPLVLSLFSFIALTFCNYTTNFSNQPQATMPPAPPAQSQEQGQGLQGQEQGSLVITFDYTRQSGSASNQFAVWIENANHEYITTLYATRYTANGGYKNRPDSIKEWVAKSNLADMSSTEVDAISGATPAAGTQTYTWDLTDAGGAPVPDGMYIFIVEGTLRWKNQVIYTGAIEVGGDAAAAAAATLTPEPQYTFEGAGNQPALNTSSTEADMITNVTARYTP